MNKILIGVLVAAVVLVGGFFALKDYPYQKQQATEAATPSQESPDTTRPATALDDASDGWKTFINERDGYSVRYPSPEAGTPETTYTSDLKDYGFETSLTFLRYGGWADMYLYDGPLEEAIAAHKRVNAAAKKDFSEKRILIGGKEGTVLSWTELSLHARDAYFIEYRPGTTLYIGGSREFVDTIRFL